MIHCDIIDMQKWHIPALSEIEKERFSQPWSEKSLLSEVENKTAKFFVAKNKLKVLGYIGMHVVLDEAYISNIAVRKDFQNMGIGSSLIKHAINFGETNSLAFLTLEVRKSNFKAIKLYEAFGFKCLGERRNFYTSPVENGKIFTYFFENSN